MILITEDTARMARTAFEQERVVLQMVIVDTEETLRLLREVGVAGDDLDRRLAAREDKLVRARRRVRELNEALADLEEA